MSNWYGEMDLVCANKYRTNFMMSAHYIAFGISGLTLFALPDLLGRKKSMTLNYFVYQFAQFLILLVPTYYARLTGYILFGLSQMKNSIAYVWGKELVPERNGNMIMVTLTSFDSGTLGFLCLYFVCISRDWFPIYCVMTALSTISFLTLTFYFPETPIWLL